MLTKEQERAINAQIVALIESTEVGSYIRMSYSGIPEMCIQNIENDFANNMPDLLAGKEREIQKLREVHAEELRKMQTRAELAEKEAESFKKHAENLTRVEHERDVLEQKLAEAEENAEKYKSMAFEQSRIITELKARLYDFIVEKEVK